MDALSNPALATPTGPAPSTQRADPGRRGGPRVGAGVRTRTVFALAASLLVFNLLDGLFTLGAVHVGAATEANPLMDLLLQGGPVTFMMGKLALVSLGVALLWRLRQHRAAVAGLAAATTVYALLCVYHIRSVHAVAGYLAANGSL